MARSFDPVPFEVRKHSHTQLMRSGLMACIALGGGDGGGEQDMDTDTADDYSPDSSP